MEFSQFAIVSTKKFDFPILECKLHSSGSRSTFLSKFSFPKQYWGRFSVPSRIGIASQAESSTLHLVYERPYRDEGNVPAASEASMQASSERILTRCRSFLFHANVINDIPSLPPLENTHSASFEVSIGRYHRTIIDRGSPNGVMRSC